MAVKMATDNTGSFTVYIDGVKLYEYNNIKTVATTSATITDIKMGGSIAQGAYDAPAHYRKFDALILTDNWQDIVNGGYLKTRPSPAYQKSSSASINHPTTTAYIINRKSISEFKGCSSCFFENHFYNHLNIFPIYSSFYNQHNVFK